MTSANLQRRALDLTEIVNRASKPPHTDVASRGKSIEQLPVIEQVGRQRRTPPTALGGDVVATGEKALQISHGGQIVGRYADMSTGVDAGIRGMAISVHIPMMDIGERIQKLMGEKGLNPYSLSIKAGLHEDTVRNIIRGATKEPSAVKLLKLARVLETSVEHMIDEDAPSSGIAPPAKKIDLPVRYRVGAGAWHEVDDIDQADPRMEVAERIDAYAPFPQWLEEVVGDSLDKMIPPGALVHVIDAIAMGYQPAHDDLVVVLRSRLGGALLQRTIKQVQMGAAGQIELWPRSHNARWGGPINITAGTTTNEDVEVQIVGKVVRAYMKFGKA